MLLLVKQQSTIFSFVFCFLIFFFTIWVAFVYKAVQFRSMCVCGCVH